jgi:hypothetical protein
MTVRERDDAAVQRAKLRFNSESIRTRSVVMSLLDEARKLEQGVVKRLKELEPLIREYDQLRKLGERLGVKYTPAPAQAEAAAAAAKPAATRTGGRGRAAKTAAKPRGARSTTARKSAGAAKSKGASGKATTARAKRAPSGRRSTGGGTRPGQRNDDVLRLVRENPGITVREIGERLGVDATGLYRVAKRLADDGNVRKDGTRLYPTEAATASTPAGDSGAGTPAEPAGASDGQATPPAPTKETTTTGGTP